MASPREGFNIDIIGRFVRKSLLNQHLTLPIAAAATFLSFDSSGNYLAKAAHVFASLGINPSAVSPALTQKVGRLALILGATGLLLSFNEWLTKWFANNWTATKRGEWDWDREIVVVTGGSQGLGAGIVHGLLARNPRTTIVVVDFVPLTWEPPTGSNIYYYCADLSDSADIKNVCEKIRTEVGHPTVLVNNAGIARGRTIMEGTYADVEMTFKVNLIAPFLLIKEFLPDMVKHNHGHIANVCSTSSFVAPPNIVDYSASKAGIRSMHDGLQLELVYRHKAPKVRLTNGVFNFIKTPLFTGSTGIPNFLVPLLRIETVSEAIVNTLYSGYGTTLILPGMMRYVSMLQGAPEWMLRYVRNGSAKYDIDFTARHIIDSKTGKLVER
ncbi:short chain dehydrogenase [Lasiosphaeria hispida]|uniref:Short chain dehydrogenase n=1 Tax=Lasiosphaeria hispida TaxID=260671 RepID=A0AAJ0MBN4_9PEZI|nr:short chain dehydrogenase [Lasiosphaeria hispida]